MSLCPVSESHISTTRPDEAAASHFEEGSGENATSYKPYSDFKFQSTFLVATSKMNASNEADASLAESDAHARLSVTLESGISPDRLSDVASQILIDPLIEAEARNRASFDHDTSSTPAV
jgi:hypothetical protein